MQPVRSGQADHNSTGGIDAGKPHHGVPQPSFGPVTGEASGNELVSDEVQETLYVYLPWRHVPLTKIISPVKQHAMF